MSGTATVTIGGVTLELRPPADAFLCWELAGYAQRNDFRGGMAALAHCWPEEAKWRPQASYLAHKCNPAAFGRTVGNELLAQGAPIGDLVVAGAAAVNLLLGSVAGGEAVKHAQGFFAAKADPSPGSSSPSSESGGSTRAGS